MTARNPVDPERGGDAEIADPPAGEGRPDHAAHLEDRRVQDDRLAHARHAGNVPDERLGRREVEGAHDPQQGREEEDVPQCDDAGLDEDREHEREDHRRGLGCDEDLASVPAVGEDAHPRPEEERGQECKHRGDAQRDAGVAQLPDDPGLGGLLHPNSDEGDDLAGEVDPHVSDAERGQAFEPSTRPVAEPPRDRCP